MATFVAAFADSPKRMDALKADAELADIPVIMISMVDESAGGREAEGVPAWRDIPVVVVIGQDLTPEERRRLWRETGWLVAGRIRKQTPDVAFSDECSGAA